MYSTLNILFVDVARCKECTKKTWFSLNIESFTLLLDRSGEERTEIFLISLGICESTSDKWHNT